MVKSINEELLEALEALTVATWDIVDGSSPNNPIRKHLSNAEAAIAKAKGGWDKIIPRCSTLRREELQ